ncbi:MAG: EF-P lysine aminoacylase GenX [Desulfobulbaceae bacterium]|nr:MAG: EF-P lysine aminoacylase GenX [Desulfobulbaceae bacterium]
MLDFKGLQLRAALLRLIRRFFHQQGFLEVDTPVRQPVLLPESNILPINSGSWFLQTSPEQCMKRILARNRVNIFQICPCFRADERGSRHLEEFTMLEWYRIDGDYVDLMDDCETLLRYLKESLIIQTEFSDTIAGSCFGTMTVESGWERVTVAEAFAKWGSMSLAAALESDRFDELVSIEIEPHLGLHAPTFLCDYPASCASLARLKKDDISLAERFELYIAGMELANGFSELTDADEQRLRFEEELDRIEQREGVRPVMPNKFLEDLKSLEPAAGIAFGFDRLLMLLLSADLIDQVVSFSPDDLE